MKKLILTIIMLASFQSFAGQDGGGGGVIRRDGMYLTFGSAKVKVGFLQGITEVPGLQLLIDTIETRQGIPDVYQSTMVDAALPGAERKYFRINRDQLDSNTYKNLIAEYIKLLGDQVLPSSLDLAAITIQNDTFLLPPFFQLKPSEQAAILFHESLWIIKPDITYAKLVDAEVIMQKHIESQLSYNEELNYVLASIIGRKIYLLREALVQDLKSGIFKKYNFPHKNGNYSISHLFPQYHTQYESSVCISTDCDSSAIFYSELRKAIRNYPDSKFLRTVYFLRNELFLFDSKEISSNPASFHSIRPSYSGGAANSLQREDCLALNQTNKIERVICVMPGT